MELQQQNFLLIISSQLSNFSFFFKFLSLSVLLTLNFCCKMYKSNLQALCQRHRWSLPEYVTIKDGPDHCPLFTASITVNGVPFETPSNLYRSSKEAQNQVAKLAFYHFKPIPQQSIEADPLPNLPIHGSSTPNTSVACSSKQKNGIQQENERSLQDGEISLGSKVDNSCKGFPVSNSSMDIGASKCRIVERHQPDNAPNLLVGETTLFVKNEQSSEGFPASNSSMDVGASKHRIMQPEKPENTPSLLAGGTPLFVKGEQSSRGIPASNSSIDVEASKRRILQPDQPENAPNLLAGRTPLLVKSEASLKDMLHFYKNRLQDFAQKRNLTLPTYTCEVMGPPHDCRFRSKVTVDGKDYWTLTFYTTLKEAEHAAAKVAFESLPLDKIQEDKGFYKNLLQELAQKEGFSFPLYETVIAGPPHVPNFVSTVKIGGESFHGHEAKTKKQAEMNAAKAAYTSFIERQARLLTTFSPGFHVKGNMEVSSFNLQPNVSDKLQSNVTVELGTKLVPKTSSSIQETLAIEDKESNANGKALGCTSPSQNAYACLNNLNPSTISPPKEGAPLFSPSSDYANKVEESEIKASATTGTSAVKKIVVRSRKPNMTFEEGATVLPISDDKWVAYRVDVN